MVTSEVEETNLKSSVLKLLKPLGGISSFIKENDTVLLKPNFNTSDPFPASTDKDFLKVILDILYEQKVKKVIIGESSTFYRNTHKEMQRLNVLDLENKYKNLEILCFEDTKWI